MTDEEIRAAIDRIARSPDGEALYRYLQKVRMEVPPFVEDGALRSHDGRRRFAAELMDLMAQGIDESGGRDADGDGRPSERPVVIGGRKPDDGRRRHVNFRDWAIDNDPELARLRADKA